MPTIREVIEESFEWYENHAKQKGYFHHKALRKLLADKAQEMEAVYQKRIEELYEKAKVYDLLMEMPAENEHWIFLLWKTEREHILFGNPETTYSANYVTPGKDRMIRIAIRLRWDWKTPQEALQALKDKLTSINK